MKGKLVGFIAYCALGGCARLLDSSFKAEFQALAPPDQVLATATAELTARGYDTHNIDARWLSGRQSELTPMAIPAMIVGVALLPLSFVTWPVVLLVVGPISPEFAAWWPIYPASIPDGATIHRNIQITADARTVDWTVVRMTAKADGRGIRDFKALHELLLRTYQTCDAPVRASGSAKPSSVPADNTR